MNRWTDEPQSSDPRVDWSIVLFLLDNLNRDTDGLRRGFESRALDQRFTRTPQTTEHGRECFRLDQPSRTLVAYRDPGDAWRLTGFDRIYRDELRRAA